MKRSMSLIRKQMNTDSGGDSVTFIECGVCGALVGTDVSAQTKHQTWHTELAAEVNSKPAQQPVKPVRKKRSRPRG